MCVTSSRHSITALRLSKLGISLVSLSFWFVLGEVAFPFLARNHSSIAQRS